MNDPTWFKPRGYGHLDAPVGIRWASAIDPVLVKRHAWSPLIHYTKKTKRYKSVEKKTITRSRAIMFASHRDAAILSKYSAELVDFLDAWYAKVGLDHTVIAYRSLGRSNYDFAKTVQDYVRSHDPIMILCFDVTGFFDNIDHQKLKTKLKWLLDVRELPEDWHRVYRFITKYRYILRDDLKINLTFGSRMAQRGLRAPIATIGEVKSAGISIHENLTSYGIPQGTPISASMSNLYMAAIDLKLKNTMEAWGFLYLRYSDDIFVACSPERAGDVETIVLDALTDEALEVQPLKTERCLLAGKSRFSFQYLGYQMGYLDAALRPGSMSRQWRSAKRAIRKAERQGLERIASGKGDKIYTRKLRSKLTHVGVRNFMSYANRSAVVLDSYTIRKQTKKLHRFALSSIARVKNYKP